MTGIDLQPIRIDTASHDEDGRLVLYRGRLVGVLVRLESAEQAEFKGCWSLEAGFGPLEGVLPEPFENLERARTWVDGVIRRGASIASSARKDG